MMSRRCGPTSPPAPSPSSSRTSRARRSCCTSSARRLRRGARRAPPLIRAGIATATAGSRWTRRATRSSSPSRRRRERSRPPGVHARRSHRRPDPRADRPAHRDAAADRRGLHRRSTSTSARAIAASAHGGQVILSRATAELVELELHRPRRAPAEGHRRGRGDLPARRRLVPAAEDDLQHEPAAAGELVRRARRRARAKCSRASRTALASSR